MNNLFPKIKFSLYSYLILIVLIAVLPILFFSGFMIDRLANAKLKTSEELLFRTAQELALAFDQEVLSTIRILETLSEGNSLKVGDIKTFHGVSARVLKNQRSWRNIILLNRTHRLTSARHVWGEDIGPVVERESLEEVFRSGHPSIGNITNSPDNQNPGFAIRVPVRNLKNEVVYVISAIYGLEPTQNLVLKYSTAPGEWVRALIDRNGILAGRSREPEKFLGTPASQTLRQVLKKTSSGVVATTTLENIAVQTGIYRAPFSGYIAAVAVPRKILNAQADDARKQGLIVGFLVLLFSASATLFLSYRMMRSIRSSADGAAKLASGKTPELDFSRIKELNSLRTSLYSASALIQSQDRAKRDFLSNISHEIRTPIGIIQGYADLLNDVCDLPDEQRNWVSTIRRNTRLLSSLVGEILDLSKIESGKLEVEQVNFSLSEAVMDIASGMRLKAEEKGIMLDFTGEENVPVIINSDPTRLRQILINIIGNAIKFTEKGFVKVHVAKIEKNNSSQIQITVTDSGIGMTSEQQAKVFEPFVQADTSTTRKFGGTGLGLTISKRLAEAIGGKLRLIESAPGKGTAIELIFAYNEPAPSAKATETEKASPETQLLSGKRLLLIEDSLDNQDLIQHFLKPLGITVVTASNGREGVDKTLTENFDIILLDIQMPIMDGYEALRVLRENGLKIPIIALTAHALKEERDRARLAGFDDFLTKPITKDILQEKLKVNLQKTTVT